MTKDSRKASSWTTREIEADSAGYVAAIQAEQADRDAEAQRKVEAADRDGYVASYVGAGGDPRLASDAYEAHKAGRAAQEAAADDEAARRVLPAETLRRV